MKIPDKISGLYGANSYPQKKVQGLRDKILQKNMPAANSGKKMNQTAGMMELKKTLSIKEIDSLTALFGYQDETAGRLYGKNNLKNIHAGMLFDMRG